MEQNIENLLEISLEADMAERNESNQLETGFDKQNNTWEIVVRFLGKFSDISGKYDVAGYELLGNFGVFRADATTIELMSQDDNILYIEKPKRLLFTLEEAKAEICLGTSVGRGLFSLGGAGVLVAIIDTGIDITSDEFIDREGNTRIAWLWDQTISGSIEHYGFGREFSSEEINGALEDGRIISTDLVRHGSNVATIACGNSGVANKSTIIAVKLKTSEDASFAWTTKLMAGIDYVLRKAAKMNMPVAINISLGNNYGSHRGDTLLEQYIDEMAEYGRNVICVGCGNEGGSAVHKSLELQAGSRLEVELSVSPYEKSIAFQAWAESFDEYEIILEKPDGSGFGPLNANNKLIRYEAGNTMILGFAGSASSQSTVRENYYCLIPVEDYIDSGIWKIIIVAGKIKAGRLDIYLQSNANLNSLTGFVQPDSELTITIPATAQSVISVAAYNQNNDSYASFSGQGIGGDCFWNGYKPEVSAPGVGIELRPGLRVSGTSFSVAFVTGIAALLMEWGIVRKNDTELYGQKVKAAIIKAAVPLPNQEIPSDKFGWGKVCFSLEKI